MSNNLINPEKDKLLIDLGLQPVTNRFISTKSVEVPKFPLELKICTDNGLIYLNKPFPVKEVKPRYKWLKCFEPEDHLDELVKRIIQLPGISKKSIFGGYSFKDDSTLQRLNELGYNRNWRIDLEKDLGINDNCSSIETFQFLFNNTKAKNISNNYGYADVLIVRHVLEHAYDLGRFIDAAKQLIKPNGYIILEIPDCEKAFIVGDCTTIWEEHIYYFTSFTFKQVLKLSGFDIKHYQTISYPFENSIIAFVQHNHLKKYLLKINDKSKINEEITRAYKFSEKIIGRKEIIRTKLKELIIKYGSIAMFGAGHLAVTFIAIMDIADLISYVIDDDRNKQGLLMPTGNIKIVGSDILKTENIGVCLLSLNPHNHNIIIDNNRIFSEKGGLFLSIFPKSELYLENIF